jgi:hypothetical protein
MNGRKLLPLLLAHAHDRKPGVLFAARGSRKDVRSSSSSIASVALACFLARPAPPTPPSAPVPRTLVRAATGFV